MIPLKKRLVLFAGLLVIILVYLLYSNKGEDSTFFKKDGVVNPDNSHTNPSHQKLVKYVDVKPTRKLVVNPDDKYLAYFPHSGYHNQRIALENALLLSKILNRTLLIPPVLLGPPITWITYRKLYPRLLMRTKNGLKHCSGIPEDDPLPAECLNFFTYTQTSWDFLMDMDPIREWQGIVDRWDLSFEWLNKTLKIGMRDIHPIEDAELWDYRIYDMREGSVPIEKYKRRIEIEDLLSIDKRLIHFGSLFGSYRVVPELPLHKNYLKFIRTHLVTHNSLLLEVADRIVAKLGGVATYIGLHIRTNDGFFMTTAKQTIDGMYHTIVDSMTELMPPEVDILEGGTHAQDILVDASVDLNVKRENTNITFKDHKPGHIVRRAAVPTKRVQCHDTLHPTDPGVNTVIFIATDIKLPRNSPLLFKFFNTFPCVFVLDDFVEELEEVKGLRNIEDKAPLASFLIPMLDAIIAAKGSTFYGTPRSTFSSYISRQLHPVFTGKEVDIKIVS